MIAIDQQKLSASSFFGQSMSPTLRHKDILLIKDINSTRIKVRDIVTFKDRNDYIVAHRIIKIVNRGEVLYYIKGDASRSIEIISASKILGKVVGIKRKNKITFLHLQRSLIYFYIISYFSALKEFIKILLKWLYYSRFFKKLIEFLFPLELKIYVIKDIDRNDDFKSFYNIRPFKPGEYDFFCGIIAKSHDNSIGKLWILKDKTANYSLYGPHIKFLYQGRNVNEKLVQEAVRLINDENVSLL